MVLPNEATKTVIDKFPDLQKSDHWEYYLEVDYNDTRADLRCCRIMVTLGGYVEDILNSSVIHTEKKQEIKEIFSLIEFFMVKGNQDVQDAAATCFLENLINSASWGPLKPESFLCYLGPESKKYCKAWDEFTGVKTEGLWD
jgi:hypothetical protein